MYTQSRQGRSCKTYDTNCATVVARCGSDPRTRFSR